MTTPTTPTNSASLRSHILSLHTKLSSATQHMHQTHESFQDYKELTYRRIIAQEENFKRHNSKRAHLEFYGGDPKHIRDLDEIAQKEWVKLEEMLDEIWERDSEYEEDVEVCAKLVNGWRQELAAVVLRLELLEERKEE